MSVCFYVPDDVLENNEPGTSAETDSHQVQHSASEDSSEVQSLQEFWSHVNDSIKKVNADDFKTQALPLARIKKIMKLDEEVKMISSEAPVLFAKAAEIFIHELTLRAWEHTAINRRRTLQRNDIATAISKTDQFDFLIDIVPRHEVKASKPRDDVPPRPSSSSDHASQPSSSAQVTQPQFVVQPCAQVLQQQSASGSPAPAPSVPHPVTLVQQLVTNAGEVQQLPVQLSAQQLQMIRLQLQQNPQQSFVIQAAPAHPPHPTPQIIQVSSQGQPQPQQLFLAQVSNNQEES